MPKQPIFLNFGKGVDTKTDPFQIPAGNFLSLENSIFTVGNRLTKRNGYGNFTKLPEEATFLTTFNSNLTAIGDSVQAFSEGTNTWVNKGPLKPLTLETLPLIRSNTNQSQIDTAISSNGIICTVYTDQTPTSLSTPRYMYALADSVTGQNLIEPTQLTGADPTFGTPRVFVLGNYFVILFTKHPTNFSLNYLAVSYINLNLTPVTGQIDSNYGKSTTVAFDAAVMNNSLFIAYNGNSTTGIKMVSLSQLLVISSIKVVDAAHQGVLFSVVADDFNQVIWVSYYASSSGRTLAVTPALITVLASTQFTTSAAVGNLTSTINNGLLTIFYEIKNNYSYDATIPTNFIDSITVTQLGVVGSPVIVDRSIGLASKAFLLNGVSYFLACYNSVFQPTYFLINQDGDVISRLAYGNAGIGLPIASAPYYPMGLPSVTLNDNVAQIGYLIKDFITSQNTSTTESITKSNIYSQSGLNLVSFTIGTSNVVPAEIGLSLHLSGGFLWQYDGYQPVEHNFYLWPDSVEGTPVNSGGSMVPQEYQYQAVYTWTDNQGNVHFSAPSIPIIVDMSTANKAFTQPTPLTPTADLVSGSKNIIVSSATGLAIGQLVTDTTTPGNIQVGSYITKIVGTTVTLSLPATATVAADALSISSICSVTLNIPTVRLTYKIANPIKIELFRWSTSQQEFFQVTSIQLPLMNNTSVDFVTFTDTAADNQIIGNSLIYTTGGVVENIGSPSFNSITLFDDRLWGIDAEDPNLLWYSKQVIEVTPVEMSDLFTIYVPPSTASEGSTGNMKCIFPMDDKLVIFKTNAIYYINGTGPDNTGANNQYSNPIFITATVGTIDQQSIVMTDNGLEFQSNKGYWLLLRSAQQCIYLGAAVERYTSEGIANSAVAIPGTTQIRATMNSGITLMMDYFYNNQWGTFTGVPAISSTIYQGSHTYLDRFGRIFKETPGLYLDGTNPVLQAFQTGWINIGGISGYQRIYELIFLGTFVSPANIVVNIAYDFREPSQQIIITPTNFTGVYGSDSLYGQTSPYGGPGDVLQWRLQLEEQKCQVFQITAQEQFDPSYGTMAGGGFTLSGITGVIMLKKGYRPVKAANTAG